MTDPWAIYDRLIQEIPQDIAVTAAYADGKWRRIHTSEGGAGMALGMDVQSRSASIESPEELVGRPLREVAELAKSWNLVEAGLGMAAINAFHGLPTRAASQGFVESAENNWGRCFHAFADHVAGKRVAVIGHFPFAEAAMPDVAELMILERNPVRYDYPDSACEYLLPGCDYVFITGSAFVNKTMPRLLELSANATTVLIGPSTPASPILLDYGADVVTAFSCGQPGVLEDGLAGRLPLGMYEAGARVEYARAGTAPGIGTAACAGESPDGTYRQRSVIRNPTIMMPRPITRFHHEIPGIG